MIPLSRRGVACGVTAPLVGKLMSTAEFEWPHRILLVERWNPERDLAGFDAALCGERIALEALNGVPVPVIHSVPLDHLAEGDVVRIDERGYVRTLYRRASRHNALFATERCNSLCLMCSQPPQATPDDWRIREMLDVIALIDPTTTELGITGGEPTLLHDGLLHVVRACKAQLPNTSLHILSNGRLFRYRSFAQQLADIDHPDLMIGVPVYSDLDSQHDYVVQASGAFEETLIGLQNLGRYGVPVEIRVVIHRLTYERLPQVAEFIYRNLTFAAHVALMGLEMMGFAIPNLDLLWIDPWEYRRQLETSTLFLADRGMNVSIYNHQLCTVPESVWPYCRQSISDWKNEYLPICESCSMRAQCGGFFSSAIRHRYSSHIHSIQAAPTVFEVI